MPMTLIKVHPAGGRAMRECPCTIRGRSQPLTAGHLASRLDLFQVQLLELLFPEFYRSPDSDHDQRTLLRARRKFQIRPKEPLLNRFRDAAEAHGVGADHIVECAARR